MWVGVGLVVELHGERGEEAGVEGREGTGLRRACMTVGPGFGSSPWVCRMVRGSILG